MSDNITVLEIDNMIVVIRGFHTIIRESSSRPKAEEFAEYARKHGNLENHELLEREKAEEWMTVYYTILLHFYGYMKNKDGFETDVDNFLKHSKFKNLYEIFKKLFSSKNGNPEIKKKKEKAWEWVIIHKTILSDDDYIIDEDKRFDADVDILLKSAAFENLYKKYG